jgi:hypothetical protein
MNIADLHRLCDALDECGGIHRFTAVVDAAAQVWQAAERRPKPTVERWEDGPHGAGMSDKTCNPAPIMPERGERLPLPPTSYGPADMLLDDLKSRVSPACRMTDIDPHDRVIAEHRELAAEYRNGVTHGIGSPIVRDFGCAQNDFGRRPVDPTIEAGDPA